MVLYPIQADARHRTNGIHGVQCHSRYHLPWCALPSVHIDEKRLNCENHDFGALMQRFPKVLVARDAVLKAKIQLKTAIEVLLITTDSSVIGGGLTLKCLQLFHTKIPTKQNGYAPTSRLLVNNQIYAYRYRSVKFSDASLPRPVEIKIKSIRSK